MNNNGLDIIHEMATGTKKQKGNKGIIIEDKNNLPLLETQTNERKKISFKKEKIRRVYKGSHIPEWLAVKIEDKSREEAVSESFLIQKILEDWFNKYE